MYLQVGIVLNITAIDSFNFVANKLSTLARMFGLKELKRGYFPHFLMFKTTKISSDLIWILTFMESSSWLSKKDKNF